MNVELVLSSVFCDAEALEKKGDLKGAATVLLVAQGTTDAVDGPKSNGAPLLNRVLKKLTEDPYLCLEVDRDADAKAIKKAYRLVALRTHPD